MASTRPDDPHASAPADHGGGTAPVRPNAAETAREGATGTTRRRGLRRRDLLLAGGGIVVGVAGTFGGVEATRAVAGAAKPTSSPTPSASAPAYTLQRFTSTMVVAPKIEIWKRPGAALAPGYLFATPQTDQFYPAIYDVDGTLVWSQSTGEAGTDFRVQQYRGEPVLTYWSGRSLYGNGQGHGVILDSSYRPIARVPGGAGLLTDLHEFELTDAGTALVTSYPPVVADLTSVGGTKDGWMFDCHIQEIDVETNKLLLDWRASDHIGLDESYVSLGTDGTSAPSAYDPYHLNAISADTDTTLLLSARHTHTIYSLDRATGEIRWRLGGKKSDFTIASDAAFAWQHHARKRSATEVTMFDNHVNTSKGTSRGLALTIDETAKTARVKQVYADKHHVGYAMGSMRPMSNGNVLVGWGTEPIATEFTADGTVVWEATALGKDCYRVAKSEWVGRPAADPDIATSTTAPGVMGVAMSWNGATEVASWRVLSGDTKDALGEVTTVTKNGFETTASVGSAAYVQAVALDASGTVLGSSRVLAA